MVTQRTPLIPALAAAAAGLLLLSGCTDDGSTPAPEETTQPTATADPAQEAQNAAFEAIECMHASFDEVAENGWEDMSPHRECAAAEPVSAQEHFGEQYRASGQFGTGETVITELQATEVDPEAQRVEATACVDTTGKKLHNSDGSEVELNPQIPLKAIKSYVVEYDEVQGRWMVTEYDSGGDEPC